MLLMFSHNGQYGTVNASGVYTHSDLQGTAQIDTTVYKPTHQKAAPDPETGGRMIFMIVFLVTVGQIHHL